MKKPPYGGFLCCFARGADPRIEEMCSYSRKDEKEVALIFSCADETAEGQMLEENFLVDMCCNKGMQSRDDEEDAEVRMIVFSGEQPIGQKEKRCPDENV